MKSKHLNWKLTAMLGNRICLLSFKKKRPSCITTISLPFHIYQQVMRRLYNIKCSVCVCVVTLSDYEDISHNVTLMQC